MGRGERLCLYRRLDYREPLGNGDWDRPTALTTGKAVTLVRGEAGTATTAARGVPAALVIGGNRHCQQSSSTAAHSCHSRVNLSYN